MCLGSHCWIHKSYTDRRVVQFWHKEAVSDGGSIKRRDFFFFLKYKRRDLNIKGLLYSACPPKINMEKKVRRLVLTSRWPGFDE